MNVAEIELAGNALSLDFANTLNSRRVPTPRDYIGDYAAWLAWSAHAGALPADAVSALARATSPDAALARAHRLRDTVYATFSAIAAGRAADRDALAELATAYGSAIANGAFVRRSDAGYALQWTPGRPPNPDAPLWPVAHSAGELLLHGPLGRIGECPGCGWLFLDTSRNGTRRWCSMATCGSRDKMARYHHRSRAR